MAELGPEHPRNLIPELCKQFYHLGWVTGTGGGISIKQGDKIYIAPSGVQKERMRHDDLFVQTIDDKDLELPPPEKLYQLTRYLESRENPFVQIKVILKRLERSGLLVTNWQTHLNQKQQNVNLVLLKKSMNCHILKKSQCTPLFLIAYRERGAGAVIHTHSPHAVRCTLLYDKEFVITHQEMIKGIKDQARNCFLRYDEKLVVPIIENTPFERDLAGSMALALEKYPGTSAVLVRRHGVYVWGETWQQAKTMTECYDYLFEMAVEMKRLGLDPTYNPETGKSVQNSD